MSFVVSSGRQLILFYVKFTLFVTITIGVCSPLISCCCNLSSTIINSCGCSLIFIKFSFDFFYLFVSSMNLANKEFCQTFHFKKSYELGQQVSWRGRKSEINPIKPNVKKYCKRRSFFV